MRMMKAMYVVKYKVRYHGQAIFQETCEAYCYSDEDEAYHVFNKRVGMIKSLFSAIIDDRFFYARVEIVKTNDSASNVARTDKHDFVEIYGSYMQKGILKIGYLGR